METIEKVPGQDKENSRNDFASIAGTYIVIVMDVNKNSSGFV